MILLAYWVRYDRHIIGNRLNRFLQFLSVWWKKDFRRLRLRETTDNFPVLRRTVSVRFLGYGAICVGWPASSCFSFACCYFFLLSQLLMIKFIGDYAALLWGILGCNMVVFWAVWCFIRQGLVSFSVGIWLNVLHKWYSFFKVFIRLVMLLTVLLLLFLLLGLIFCSHLGHNIVNCLCIRLFGETLHSGQRCFLEIHLVITATKHALMVY